MKRTIATLAILLFALVSGAAALVYEIAFFRALAIAFGVDAHAVAVVVAAFLGGLTLGAWLGGRLLCRPHPLRAYPGWVISSRPRISPGSCARSARSSRARAAG